ncbi:MAG: hypothetical protein IPP88_20640 [Betaproteobacteria bacterium]|nr:hypothetical protein [Betaproteobacteria bacterium]
MKFVSKSTRNVVVVTLRLHLLAFSQRFARWRRRRLRRSFGVITDFASIYVNGVEYFISGANIIINGVPNRPESELKLGMAVRVEGTVNSGGLTGTATLVEFGGDIEGTVDATPVINGTNGRLNILGLVINTDRKTFYENVANLAAINAGDVVEVSGFFNANDGSYTASRVEKKASLIKYELRGIISNVTGTTFVIGPSQVVDYSTADLSHGAPGTLANGKYVEVKRTTIEPVVGTLVADRVSIESSVLASTDMQLGLVQGLAANVTPTGFVMGNQPIVMNAQTVFDGAPLSALTNGAKAVATGPVVSGVMTAAAVTITPALVSVKSRKTHGAAGVNDILIAASTDISGAVTVEPRAMGSAHNIVFQFDGPISSVGSVTSKDATGLIEVGSATFAIPAIPEMKS